jgi:hypothetical protein
MPLAWAARHASEMAAQLPTEQLGTAVGVLLYSLVCLLASVTMIWLLVAHHEAKSCKSSLVFFLPPSPPGSTTHVLTNMAQTLPSCPTQQPLGRVLPSHSRSTP